MSSTAQIFRLQLTRAPNQCEKCPTILPNDGRRLCQFHRKPPVPYSAPESRLEHVRRHLRPQDRDFLDHLLEPVSLTDIAERMGEGWTRSMVQRAWKSIKLTMRLEQDIGDKQGVERLALLRIVAGFDACWCMEP